MAKFFIDFEFQEGFHQPFLGKRRHYIDLISVGIVREDGKCYYAISKDFDYTSASPWIKENVIPHLDTDYRKYKSNKQITDEIAEFFCCYKDGDELKASGKIEVYGYYCDYDWVLFCSLFGRMRDLPKGFPWYCIDLKQMMHERGLTDDWKKIVGPEQIHEHHALHDAIWNMQLYKAIIKTNSSL